MKGFIFRILGILGILLVGNLFAEEIPVDENLVILLADTHLGAYEEADAQFQTVVEKIVRKNPRPGMVLILGDLAGTQGTLEEYQKIRPLLQPLEENGIRWEFLIGNHDHRETLFKVFPEKKVADNPVEGRYIQCISTPRADFILLDSRLDSPEMEKYMAEKETYPQRRPWDGYEDPRQTEWLEKKLAAAPPNRPIFVCAHHPLEQFPIDSVLAKFSQVQGYLYGHVHQIRHFQHNGVDCFLIPTTSHRENGMPSGWVEMSLQEKGVRFTIHTFRPTPYEGNVWEKRYSFLSVSP